MDSQVLVGGTDDVTYTCDVVKFYIVDFEYDLGAYVCSSRVHGIERDLTAETRRKIMITESCIMGT